MPSPFHSEARSTSSQTSSRPHPEGLIPGSSQTSSRAHPAHLAGLARAPAVISVLSLLSSGSPSSLPKAEGMRRSQSAREGSSGSSGMNRDEVRSARAVLPRLIRSSSRPLGGGAAERGAGVEGWQVMW